LLFAPGIGREELVLASRSTDAAHVLPDKDIAALGIILGVPAASMFELVGHPLDEGGIGALCLWSPDGRVQQSAIAHRDLDVALDDDVVDG
jgi:hypothetical protein